MKAKKTHHIISLYVEEGEKRKFKKRVYLPMPIYRAAVKAAKQEGITFRDLVLKSIDRAYAASMP